MIDFTIVNTYKGLKISFGALEYFL